MSESEHADLLVVGSGILGTIVASLAANEGAEVVQLGRKDLVGSTFNNHGWLQGGPLYLPHDPELAHLLHVQGARLLARFALSPEPGPAILRVTSDAAAEEFERACRSVAIDDVEVVRPSDLAGLAGPFARGMGHWFHLPDRPFRIGRLMRIASEEASRRNVKFRETPTGVTLEPSTKSAGGFIARAGSQEFIASRTILCAGAGTPSLLDPLGVRLPIAVFRSPLVRLQADPTRGATLLVDRHSGLSLVHHVVGHGRLGPRSYDVYGNGYRRKVTDTVGYHPGHLIADEFESLQLAMPTELLRGCHPLWNVCLKTERLLTPGEIEHLANAGLPKRETTVLPWYYAVAGYPGLFAGGSGKATLALHAAEQLLLLAGVLDENGSLKRDQDAARQPDHSERTVPGVWYEKQDANVKSHRRN